MENGRIKNIVEKDGDTRVYIPAGRFYGFECFLLFGVLLLIGSCIVFYGLKPKTFPSFWSRESMIYIGILVLALFFIGHEFKTLRKNAGIPQMIIGNKEVSFKRNGKGGPLLTSGYVTLKYKHIISASYPSEHDYNKLLTFMTATQLYPVGLILEREDKKIVYQILQSKLAGYSHICVK